MSNNPLTGASYLLRGFDLTFKPRIRRYVVVPLLVNIALFLVLIYVLFLGFDWLAETLDGWLPAWLDWLTYLLWPLFFLSAVLMPAFGFVLVGNLVASPFNGFLAEAVERELTGRALAEESGWRAIVAEVGRSLRSETRKLGYTLLRAAPILVLLWIPGLNILGSALWMLLGAWLMAIQYADYPMGNHRLEFPEQRALLGQHRLLALGFGASVMLVAMIPVVNFFVMPASVAGATALWVDVLSVSARRLKEPPSGAV